MLFNTILLDPPWGFNHYSHKGNKKSGEHHYDCHDPEWLLSLPVASVAAKNATLLLWTSFPHLDLAMKLFPAYGFVYKSGMPWVKLSKTGAIQMGTGYHIRAASELLLLGTRGDTRAPLPADKPLGVLFNGRAEHSRKPDTQYEIAENYPGPYVEIFSRPREGDMFGPRPGWVFVGNEIDGLDVMDALAQLAEKEQPE